MSTRVFLFGLWCMALLLGSFVSSYYAWALFPDGSRSTAVGFYGPTHK
jgi:hypothetical protein